MPNIWKKNKDFYLFISGAELNLVMPDIDHMHYVRYLLIYLKNVFISSSDSVSKQQASSLLAVPQPRKRYS
jgi:hypothetical protein